MDPARISSAAADPGSGDRQPNPRFNERVAEQLADAMFALSAPSRVQILGCLVDGPLSVGEIAGALEMEQSAVSHQLRVLRDHSLVAARREGKRRVYTLADEHVSVLLDQALQHVERRRDRGWGASISASGA